MYSPKSSDCGLVKWVGELLGCLSFEEEDGRSDIISKGVEREMKIYHNQPHLVQPMKLVIYDEMPPTPVPQSALRLSQLLSQTKNLASRLSSRASLSVRRLTLSRPIVSSPLASQSADDLPLRRRQPFRPLELSIYMAGNRLSDLPRFEEIDFNTLGELQAPDQAHLRARSEILHSHQQRALLARKTTASMVGERQLEYWQRASSVISSRPPSEYDALHSHPVDLESLSCLSNLSLHRQTEQLRVMSPMPEEPLTARRALSRNLTVETRRFSRQSSLQFNPPFPSSLSVSMSNMPCTIKPTQLQRENSMYSHSSSFKRTRISLWLSRSTSSTTNQTAVSANHASNSHFYHCAVSSSQSKGRPTSRSTIGSRASLGLESISSMTTMTTAPTFRSRHSRSSTMRSMGKTVIAVDEEMPLPPSYAEMREAEVQKMAHVFSAASVGLAF